MKDLNSNKKINTQWCIFELYQTSKMEFFKAFFMKYFRETNST